MYNIGEVSSMCDVPISTLRYYDKIGLLRPAMKDPDSRYRYYSEEQLDRIEIINFMKYMGRSLEEIKCLMGQNRTPRSLSMLLEESIGGIDDEIQKLMEIRKDMCRKRKQLTELYYGTAPGIVYRKKIKKRYIYREHTDTLTVMENERFNYYVRKIAREIRKEYKAFEYHMGALCPWEYYTASGIIEYRYIFLDITDFPLKNSKKVIELAEGEYLCIKYRWAPENSLKYFGIMNDYIQEHRLKVEGFAVEMPLISGIPQLIGDDYMLELQIKILS